MRNSRWLRLLAYVTGSVNQELLLRNKYLAAENRILRTKLPSRFPLSNPETLTLAEIGKRLGGKLSAKSPALPSQTRFWLGAVSSSLGRLMAPNIANTLAGRRRTKTSRN
jgi:hypothetical protein